MSAPCAAVIGTGFIGPVHVEALCRLGVRVRGVLGSSPAKSQAAASALGLERAYGGLAELLADPQVDVVHVASPNRQHHAQVLAALAAGKHVVCEKPLGMSATESRELLEAAARYPTRVCAVNYNVRFYPAMLHARALIQRGELGEIVGVHGSYAQDWLLWPKDFNWRVLAGEGGALRAVGDIGTHWLDLAQFVSGLVIEQVCADLQTVHAQRIRPPRGSVETFGGAGQAAPAGEPVAVTTEDAGAVLLRWHGGARGSLWVSQVTAGRKNCIRLEIAGSRRSLAWNSERPEELWIGNRDEPSQLLLRDPAQLDVSVAGFSNYPAGHAEGFPDAFKQLYRAIYADVRAGRRSEQPLYATFADGHRELQLCAAIATSHASRAWVPVEA